MIQTGIAGKNPKLRLIRRTQKSAVVGRVQALSRKAVAPPITTTSASGAQRLFSSFLFTFQRSAASTATQNKSLLSCTVSISFARNYAKRRGMPPKKAVKEEKILLGRPGNNLKSGIVCLPLALKPDCLLIKSRSALQTSASRHSSKLSPNAHSEILL